MAVDYAELRKIYRLEKQSKTRLTTLHTDFYTLLSKYIQSEKKEVIKALEQQDTDRLIFFANLKKLVEELISIRQRKIVSLALASVFGEPWEPENLVGWERDFYRDVVEILRRYRDEVRVLVGLEERKKEEEDREGKEKSLKLIRVKILGTVPEFVGSDYKTYGPYSGGEVVELPRDIADILVVRGFAEVVRDEEDSDAQV